MATKFSTFFQVSYGESGSFARFATAAAAEAFAIAVPSPIACKVSRLSGAAHIVSRWSLDSDVEAAASRGAAVQS